MKHKFRVVLLLLLAVALLFSGCLSKPESPSYDLENIPDFDGSPYVVIGDNTPQFTQTDKEERESWETYTELDTLGRCGVVMACIGRDIMPTEERGSIGQVKPSGWQTIKYDFVDGKYLYNRCHLIGFQLTGENANRENLITGTRYMNVEGMLPFENMVADYVKETGNHVLYRVTPCFEGNELVARGVLMEAWSLEDAGEGICFFVYVYNAQPGVDINYASGESRMAGQSEEPAEPKTYVVNTNSNKFHTDDCPQADKISNKNRQVVTASREELIVNGCEPAGCCNP